MRKVLYVLGQLTDQDVDWLARAGKTVRVSPGTMLITQGKQIDSMYILLDGNLAVLVDGVGEVAQLYSGAIVGEMSFIDFCPPSASVKAVNECTVLDLPRRAMTRKLQEDVGFSARFHRAVALFLSDRLRATTRRMARKAGTVGNDDAEREGEIDINVLGDIHLAGARFDRMLKKLIG